MPYLVGIYCESLPLLLHDFLFSLLDDDYFKFGAKNKKFDGKKERLSLEENAKIFDALRVQRIVRDGVSAF